MKHATRRTLTLAIAAAIATAAPGNAKADEPTQVKRTILHREDLTIPGWEALLARVELPPGSREDRHTHPTGEVYGFVDEGSIALEVEGRPTRSLSAGDFFTIPLGKIHRASNDGSVTAKLSVVFIAEKGKPLTVPVGERPSP